MMTNEAFPKANEGDATAVDVRPSTSQNAESNPPPVTPPPGRRGIPAGARRLIILAGILALVMLLSYLIWLRPQHKPAVRKPPDTLDAGHNGEGTEAHNQQGAVEVSDETAELVGIKTEPVVRGDIDETIAATGKVLVTPNGQALVGAKADGRVLRVLAEPGQQVTAGQTLIVIDSPQVADLRGQLIEAGAKLRLAQQKRERTAKSENRATVIQAKNRLELAEATFERKKRLLELGGTAAKEVAQAETEYKNARAEYEFQSTIQVPRELQEAASEVDQQQAVVARLTQSLTALGASAGGQGGSLILASPISGTVVDRRVSVGQAVNQGSELMTVMNLSNVIIEVHLPESQAGRVQAGQRLIARLPGDTERRLEGKVESVGGAIDPVSRTIPVRSRLTNVGATLKHEMAVEVRIVSGSHKNALLVPVSALVDDEGIKVVYVKEGQRYERRPVTVGMSNYTSAEVLSGVEAGEEVVTAGAYQLKNLGKGSEGGGEHDDDH